MVSFFTNDPGHGLAAPAADLARGQVRNQQWREQVGGAGQQVLQNRQAESAMLPQQYVDAGSPASAFQMQDDMRGQAFNAARRGTTGGSADLSNRGRIKGAHGTRLAGMFAQGQGAERAQNLTDQQQLLQWMAQAYGSAPGESLALQSQLDASRARAGQESQMGSMALQADQNQMQYQALMSQILGGQMSNTAGMLGTAGQLGVGPQWAQGLGNSMTQGRG